MNGAWVLMNWAILHGSSFLPCLHVPSFEGSSHPKLLCHLNILETLFMIPSGGNTLFGNDVFRKDQERIGHLVRL